MIQKIFPRKLFYLVMGMIIIFCFGMLYFLIFSNPEKGEEIEKKTTQTIQKIEDAKEIKIDDSGSNIIEDSFRIVGGENYLYDNKFQKIIFNFGNENTYEEISRLFLYTFCFRINNIVFECKEDSVLKYFISEENEKYFTVSKSKNTYIIINKSNNKKLRITPGESGGILLMLLN